jgi:hypothetical protein
MLKASAADGSVPNPGNRQKLQIVGMPSGFAHFVGG